MDIETIVICVIGGLGVALYIGCVMHYRDLIEQISVNMQLQAEVDRLKGRLDFPDAPSEYYEPLEALFDEGPTLTVIIGELKE